MQMVKTRKSVKVPKKMVFFLAKNAFLLPKRPKNAQLFLSVLFIGVLAVALALMQKELLFNANFHFFTAKPLSVFGFAL